jgi:nucleotide-binding universal stress UspA family protein
MKATTLLTSLAFSCTLTTRLDVVAAGEAKMYKRMLVLLDGSKMAEVVFSYARELSGRLGLDLDLLHVCNTEEAQQLPMRQAYIEHMAETLQAQSREICNRAEVQAARKPVEAVGKVLVGYPAEEILKYADENKADIIMLATHGRSGIRRWGLGSVADKVIHEANVPIWLVPAGLHEGILYDNIPGRTILIPLDGSKPAEAVIPHVINLTRQRGVATRLLLINVAKPTTPKFTEFEKYLIGEDLASMKKASELYLKGMVEKLTAAGLSAEYEQLVGDPAEEIVRYAAANQPRLIVMSTHGRSGVSRVVFGSVAENVLRRLQKTPVFLIRPTQS